MHYAYACMRQHFVRVLTHVALGHAHFKTTESAERQHFLGIAKCHNMSHSPSGKVGQSTVSILQQRESGSKYTLPQCKVGPKYSWHIESLGKWVKVQLAYCMSGKVGQSAVVILTQCESRPKYIWSIASAAKVLWMSHHHTCTSRPPPLRT